MIDAILTNLVTAVLTSKYVLLPLAYGFAATLVFWSLWVTLNVAYNRKKRLAYRLLLIALAIPGLIVDVLYNATIGTILFLELPKETTLSMRLTRYLSGRTPNKLGTADYGYRVPVAVWIATNLVEPWQRGHLGLEKWGYPAARDALSGLLRRVP